MPSCLVSRAEGARTRPEPRADCSEARNRPSAPTVRAFRCALRGLALLSGRENESSANTPKMRGACKKMCSKDSSRMSSYFGASVYELVHRNLIFSRDAKAPNSASSYRYVPGTCSNVLERDKFFEKRKRSYVHCPIFIRNSFYFGHRPISNGLDRFASAFAQQQLLTGPKFLVINVKAD